MNPKEIDEKIKMAKAAVANHEEPYKTEAFKIVLAKLLEQKTHVQEASRTEAAYPAHKAHDATKTYSFSGVSKHIYALLLEGLFDKPQGLKMVKGELEKNSCFYDIRIIDASLRNVFVKNNKILTRVKNGGRWAYALRK